MQDSKVTSKSEHALRSLLTVNCPSDIMIVDTRSDINVYKGLVQGQMNTKEDSTSQPSCCGGAQRDEIPSEDLLEHDFNEWAGESNAIKLIARH